MVNEIQRSNQQRMRKEGFEISPRIDPTMEGAVKFRQPGIPGEGLQDGDQRLEGTEQG
jgi:hypothetical protein